MHTYELDKGGTKEYVYMYLLFSMLKQRVFFFIYATMLILLDLKLSFLH